MFIVHSENDAGKVVQYESEYKKLDIHVNILDCSQIFKSKLELRNFKNNLTIVRS